MNALLHPMERDTFAGTKESLNPNLRNLDEIMYLYKIEVNPKLHKIYTGICMIFTDPIWLSSHLIVRALTTRWQKAILIFITALILTPYLLPSSKPKGSTTEISISHSLTVTLKQ